MSNPSVVATVSVNDQASPALKQLADLAKMIAKEMDSLGKGDGIAQSYRNATGAAKEHLGVLTKMRTEAAGIAKEFAGAIAASKLYRGAKDAVKSFLPYQ